MKKAPLLRYPHPSSLRRTSMVASLLRVSGALHLSLFDQPVILDAYSDLLLRRGAL